MANRGSLMGMIPRRADPNLGAVERGLGGGGLISNMVSGLGKTPWSAPEEMGTQETPRQRSARQMEQKARRRKSSVRVPPTPPTNLPAPPMAPETRVGLGVPPRSEPIARENIRKIDMF